MKFLFLYALLFLLPASLFADEIISVETKFLESNSEIPHDINKLKVYLKRHKEIDLMSAPKVATKSGHEGMIKIINEYQPESVPPSSFKPVPLGIIVHITPYLKEDIITYNAQFTVSNMISRKSANGKLQSVISSRDTYVSDVIKDGGDLWFDFNGSPLF